MHLRLLYVRYVAEQYPSPNMYAQRRYSQSHNPKYARAHSLTRSINRLALIYSHLVVAQFGSVANVPDELEAHVLRGRAAHPVRGLGAVLAHVQATQR